MNNNIFESNARNLLKHAKEVRDVKKTEYRADFDRLANFRKQAALKGETVLQAISGNMSKHTVSIYDMISDADHDVEKWEEKLGDQINYLLCTYNAVIEKQ